jgi:hypothetical protein
MTDEQELDHVVDLAQERDFGIGLEDEAKVIIGQGKDIRTSKELKELRYVLPMAGERDGRMLTDRPKREDIVADK